MGLNDLVNNDTEGASSRYKRYGDHPYNEKLQDWFDQYESLFPEKIECDFIEVSPELESNAAKVYWKIKNGQVHQYIRIAESVTGYRDEYVKHYLLDCMVSLYFYQNGYRDISRGSNAYKFVAGLVGANSDLIDKEEPMWDDVALPLLHHLDHPLYQDPEEESEE